MIISQRLLKDTKYYKVRKTKKWFTNGYKSVVTLYHYGFKLPTRFTFDWHCTKIEERYEGVYREFSEPSSAVALIHQLDTYFKGQ